MNACSQFSEYKALIAQKKSRNYSFADLFAGISIVLSFFLSQYLSFIPGVTLGELVLIISSLLLFAKYGFRFKTTMSKFAIMFYLCCLLFTFFSILVSGVSFAMASEMEIISRWIRYYAYVLFLIFYFELFNNGELLKSIYRVSVILISTYAIFQFLAYITFRIVLPVNLLPFSMEKTISSEAIATAAGLRGFRAYGVFTEPSYLAKFLFPGLLFSLFGWRKKRIYFIDAGIILLAILLSASLQGYVIALTTILLFLLRKESGIKLVPKIIVFSTLVAVVLLVVFGNNNFNAVFSRLLNFIRGGTDYSSSLRLLRGFSVWTEMPFVYKLVGTGLGNAANFVSSFNISTSYDYYVTSEETLEYMSGISKVLVENGLILFTALAIAFFVLYKKSNALGKLLIVQLLLILLSGSSLFSVLTLSYLFYILLLGRQQSESRR